MRTLALVLVLAAVAASAPAGEMMDSVVIAIQGHRFAPAQLVIAADQKVIVVIQNHDPTPETFAIPAIGVTQALGPVGRAILYIGPLHAGRYAFVGETHPQTARGTFVAAYSGY